jgi:hypothetical protein
MFNNGLATSTERKARDVEEEGEDEKKTAYLVFKFASIAAVIVFIVKSNAFRVSSFPLIRCISSAIYRCQKNPSSGFVLASWRA